jgi:molybdenum cofactor cytidylyltransferase
VVVIGAHAHLLKRELEHRPVLVAENREWEKGMSSSIRTGVETLVAASSEIEGVVTMLCDQPFVTAEVINGLVEAHCKTSKMVVASAYREACGVPAFFSGQLFAELEGLEANGGARDVIANHSDDLATVFFPEGAIDPDTPQDYEMLEAIMP